MYTMATNDRPIISQSRAALASGAIGRLKRKKP
jgi:hypothetical protein